MAPTQVASSSAALTLNTDTQVGSDITTAGLYVMSVDTDLLVDGETLLAIFKEKVLSGSSFTEVDRVVIAKHAQGPGVTVKFGPYEIIHGGQFFVRQEGGTGRAVERSVRRLDG